MPRKPLYELVCFACGKPFQTTRQDAKTCSPRCRQRHKRSGWTHPNAHSYGHNHIIFGDGTKGGLVFRPR